MEVHGPLYFEEFSVISGESSAPRSCRTVDGLQHLRYGFWSARDSLLLCEKWLTCSTILGHLTTPKGSPLPPVKSH
jgi:hypothetical protein